MEAAVPQTNFYYENEVKTNALAVKVLWGIFLVGHTVNGLANAVGMAETATMDFIMALIGSFVLFMAGTLVQRFGNNKPYVKYLVCTSALGGCFIVSFFIQRGVFMSPMWFAVLAICALYYDKKLIIIMSVVSFILNFFLITNAVPDFLEHLTVVNLISNPITFILGLYGITFVVQKGKEFIDNIVISQQESYIMRQKMETIIADAKKVASAALNVSEDIHKSSESFSSSIEQIASAANEFAASVQELADKSGDMAATSKQISAQASKGREDVDNALSQIDTIRQVIERVHGSVNQLVDKIKEVGAMISTINNIANQTNMLALNAAIEAARAGRHGQGFAVVADEVRRLSEEVSSTAQDISVIIEDNESEAEETVKEIISGVEQVKTSSVVIKETGLSFWEVIKSVEGVAGSIVDIANMGKELGSGSESLAATTQQQSASVYELVEMAGNLRDTSQELLDRLHE